MYVRSPEESIGSSGGDGYQWEQAFAELLMCASTEGNCPCGLPEFGRNHSLDQLLDGEVLFKDHIQY